MYKSYKNARNKFKSGHAEKAGAPESESRVAMAECINTATEDAVKTQVAESWRNIDKQCLQYLQSDNFQNAVTPGAGSQMTRTESRQAGHNNSARFHSTRTDNRWQTVRLFVSSTFTDFHNEREALVKKVFPALREWCEKRKLHLIECDLRWGVPREASTKTTICTCLEELDRCHHDNQGQPFFLNMIGERYGWIPSSDEIPDDIKEIYEWVPHTSITFMEILHGAYRTRNPNAVFFLRDNDFHKDLPEKHRKAFIDEDPLQKEQLKMLKLRLRKEFVKQLYDYRCHINRIDLISGRERVILDGLDEFSEKVLQFFQSAIERMYPHSSDDREMTYCEQKTDMHLSYVEQRADSVVGRDEEVERILEFARNGVTLNSGFEVMSGGNGEEEKMKYLKDWGMTEDDSPILCMVAPSGYGKTSILSSVVVQAMKKGMQVFHHFVGSDARSNIPSDCTFRLISALSENADDTDKLKYESELNQRPVLIKLLGEARQKSDQFLVVIDGLDQMIDSNEIHSTAWLPCRFPGNMRCIVSSRDHGLVLDRLAKRGAVRWNLDPVAMETRQMIAEHYLGRYNKKLDREQLTLLLDCSGSILPQWLSLACEELRIFGDFRGVTSMVRSFPVSLEGLITAILERKIKEDETGCLEKLLCLIHSSMAGLPEEDIQMLLGNGSEPVPYMTWAVLRRSLKPFIQTVTAGSLYIVNRIKFYNSVVKEVVEKQYIGSDKDVASWHGCLADHYQYRCNRTEVIADELPFQLIKAGYNRRLVDFLRQDGRAFRINEFFKRKYMKSICCQKPAVGGPNSKPQVLCNMCNSKAGLYKRGQKPAETCLICGLWLAMASMKKAAQTCFQHTKLGRPGADLCFECGAVIVGAHAPGHQVSLCTWCWKPNACCVLLV